MKIIFLLDKQVIKRTDSNVVVAGSRNYLYAHFAFASADWTAPVTVLFNETPQLLDENGDCLVPWEVIAEPGSFQVSAFCSTVHTANVANVPVEKTLYKAGETPPDPSPDVYTQLTQMVQEAIDTAESVRDDADAGKLDGKAATIQVGEVTASAPGSEPKVTNSGTENAAVFDFVLPRGQTGPTGPAATIEVESTVTGEPGTQASVENVGTTAAAKLKFTIPKGDTGQNGVTPTLAAGNVETLEPDQPATASVTGEGPDYQINLGIPRGQTGAQGTPGQDGQDGQTPTIAVGTVTTLDPGQDATAEITGETPNLTLNLGIPEGQPGQDGVQLNDDAINTTEAWSSKKIVDTLCPSFSVSGNPVTCNPVEDYPLSAVVTLEPKQAGSGDPSPENVRPITGLDRLQATRCGRNLLNLETQTFTRNKEVLLDDEIPPGSYTLSANVQTNSGSESCLVNFLDSQNALVTSAYMPVSDTSQMRITLSRKVKALSLFAARNNIEAIGHQATLSNIQLELGSTPTDYEPYQGDTYDIALPETVYGGTLDAVTGVGSKTWGFIASYNGEALPGEWISDRDVYASGTTPTTGAQVAYKLATPEPFQATGNQALPAVAGLNTVYTDGDSLAVSGRQDLLYTLQTMQAQTTNLNRFIAEGGAING